MLASGGRLGKYQLERLLGRGGMGEVWAARDPDLDRQVAVKVVRGALADSDEARARLQREGRAMARLRHPNVITVHDAMFADGRALIAMELIDGEDLARWLARPHPQREIVEALLAAGRGLAAAHDAGMLHRDFKPHNVLIERSGRVVVTDFGLARAVGPATVRDEPDDAAGASADDPGIPTATATKAPDPPIATTGTGDTAVAATMAAAALGVDTAVAATIASHDPARAEAGGGETVASRAPGGDGSGSLESTLTRTGTLLGTPAYMAPEQLLARSTDARCDQFAFCVSAWEALAGARPFQGNHEAAILAAIEAGEVAHEARVPRRLRAILRRGLARDAAARWPSMTALLRALERAWRRPRRIALASGGAVALAAVAAAFVLALQPAGPTCADEGAAIAQQWNPGVAALLRARMLATGAPHAERMFTSVAAAFTRYADDWTAMRAAACAAHRNGDVASVQTLACLDARRTGLAGFVAAAMTKAEHGKLAHVLVATELLEPIATCAHANRATTTFDDAARARSAISDAKKLFWNGKHAEARHQIAELIAGLEPLGYPPLRALALIEAAYLARSDDDFVVAEADLRQALAMAESGGDDRVKVIAATELAFVLISRGQLADLMDQNQRGEFDDARRTLELAEASLARLGLDLKLEAMIVTDRGALAMALGSLDEAARLLERGLELAREVEAPITGRATSLLVIVYTKLGRTAEARALEAPGGKDDQAVDASGDCLRAADSDDDRTLARCNESLALLERKEGAGSTSVGGARQMLAAALSLRGDHAGARQQYVASAAICEAQHSEHFLGITLLMAGLESMELDDAHAAIEQFRRAAMVADKLGADGEQTRLLARAGLGRALAATHQDAEAIVELEWALHRLEALAPPRDALSQVQLALAEALWRRNSSHDREYARLYAVSARKTAIARRAALATGPLASLPDVRKNVARAIDRLMVRISAWQSTHR